ncbi:class A beta-lactamase [Bdellovibrio sp. HCB274]|uniref:class A beta-lactamase n=1 Tax=Bdellovibrio sp. HCB274 TaxID=3394361 RepID=UPI0039B4BFD1
MTKIFFVLLLILNSGFSRAETEIEKIERKHKVEIGVHAVQGAKSFSNREDQRFAYCSTFKWILCAAVLKKVEEGKLKLQQPVGYKKKDLIVHSPVTTKNLKEGSMSVGDLCAATIQTSDNAAANLLSALVGDLKGLESFARGYGDSTIRFDRPEPLLNTNIAGDLRDTTTAKAMTTLLKNVISGPGLSKESKEQLLTWMKGTTTGANRIRASIPSGWAFGGKTGTANQDAANDVAVIYPPNQDPIYITVFVNGKGAGMESREAAIAETTKEVIRKFAP